MVQTRAQRLAEQQLLQSSSNDNNTSRIQKNSGEKRKLEKVQQRKRERPKKRVKFDERLPKSTTKVSPRKRPILWINKQKEKKGQTEQKIEKRIESRERIEINQLVDTNIYSAPAYTKDQIEIVKANSHADSRLIDSIIISMNYDEYIFDSSIVECGMDLGYTHIIKITGSKIVGIYVTHIDMVSPCYLWLYPQYRRQGIGRIVIDYFMDRARTLGLHAMNAVPRSADSLHFMRAIGFEKQDSETTTAYVWMTLKVYGDPTKN